MPTGVELKGKPAAARRPSHRFSAEVRTRQQLVAVALGRKPAELIIRNATVLNAATLCWEEGQEIVIAAGRIAYVGPSRTWPGQAAETRDLRGWRVVAGFGESHKHIESSHLSPEYEAALVLPLGNTWTVECSHEFSNVQGDRNVEFWLKAREHGSPLKIFPVIGSATPPTAVERTGGWYGYREIAAQMAESPWVLGLDEVMDWPAVSNPGHPGHQRIWENIQATLDARGVVEGHGTALRDRPTINAFAAAGLSSDHEGRMPDEILEKLRRGLFVQLKKEFIPVGVKRLVEAGIRDWSNLALCTDDRDAEHALREGTMDTMIRLAIGAGAPIEAAYAMATIYPARHHHIDQWVGSVAPGRFADLVVLTGDPAAVEIAEVYADGVRVAAAPGRVSRKALPPREAIFHRTTAARYLAKVPKIAWPAWATQTVRLKRPVRASDFVIPAPPGKRGYATAAIQRDMYRAAGIETAELPIVGGAVQRDLTRDIIKVATVERHRRTGGIGKMFWTGMGPLSPDSALAVSVSHDAHHLTVVGSSDEAMALAINTLARQQGGWVLVAGGRVRATVRFEIAGLMSARPPAAVAADLLALEEAAREITWIGEPGIPRRLAFALITCTPNTWRLVLPYPGNPQGLHNLVTGKSHPTVW
jgi:adenine deaminase